jgi:hypothetical protein
MHLYNYTRAVYSLKINQCSLSMLRIPYWRMNLGAVIFIQNWSELGYLETCNLEKSKSKIWRFYLKKLQTGITRNSKRQWVCKIAHRKWNIKADELPLVSYLLLINPRARGQIYLESGCLEIRLLRTQILTSKWR